MNSSVDQDLIFFADDVVDDNLKDCGDFWKILIVDDERVVHESTQMVLNTIEYEHKQLKVISAYSGEEAKVIISKNDDIAVILLDVVMEQDDAGFGVIKYIRQKLKNKLVRIIIHTGQPDQAPEREVIFEYDIDGYNSKPILAEQIFTTVISSLRTYALQCNLDRKVKERTCKLKRSQRKLKKEIKHRIQAEERIRVIAHTDELTGLANRVLFNDRIGTAMNSISRHSYLHHSAGLCSEKNNSFCATNNSEKKCNVLMAVLMIDLDKFKQVNDTYGHKIGDQLLIAVAKKIESCVRKTDTVSRLGGDEFAVILHEINRPSEAAFIANKIVTELSVEFYIEQYLCSIGCSIGISIFPCDGLLVDDLISRADQAMYMVKRMGRNGFRFFDDHIQGVLSRNKRFRKELAQAIEDKSDKIYLEYLPKARVKNNEIIGFEALVRWGDANGNTPSINTNELLKIAEESGLIISLGYLVISMISEQITEWKAAGLNPLPVDCNLSVKQIKDKDIVNIIDDVVKMSQLSSNLIKFDLIERAIVQEESVPVENVIEELKKRQFSVSIDNYGTGFSSVQDFTNISPKGLKIDISLIQKIGHCRNAELTIKAIIAMANELEVRVVAVGVETKLQLKFLQNCQCHEYQGFLLCGLQNTEGVQKILKKIDH